MNQMTQGPWWEQEYEPGWPSEMGEEPAWWKPMVESKGQCIYCGVDGTSDARILAGFQSDHLVPKDPKRKDNWLNFVLACANCNKTKHRYDPSNGAGPPANEEERKQMIEKSREEIFRRWNKPRKARDLKLWRIQQLSMLAQKSNK